MSFLEFFKQALEYNSFDMYGALYMITRSIVIYLLGILLFRFNKKMMNIHSPFNFTIFVMMGSIFAQSILVKEVFLHVICVIIFLWIFNFMMKKLAFHFEFFEKLVKGYPTFLIKKGQVDWNQMNKPWYYEARIA